MGKPEEPDRPDAGEEPGKPDQPAPAEPEASEKPEREDPEDPEDPEVPEEPEEPEAPEQPERPERPEQSDEPEESEEPEKLEQLEQPEHSKQPETLSQAELRWQMETAELPVVSVSPGQTIDTPSLAELAQEQDALPLVLCIDADRDNLSMLERVLATTNRYRVACFTDGIRGLQAARQQRPALILMDLDLPLVDGFEIHRRLRDDVATAAIPVVAVTASVMKGERRGCSEAGFNAFVEKPFDIHELRRLVVSFTSSGVHR